MPTPQSWLPLGFDQITPWQGRRLPPNPQPPPRYNAASVRFENFTISGVDHDACVVSWAVTENANVQVEYGPYPLLHKTLETVPCQAHVGYSRNVVGLAASTTYGLSLEAIDVDRQTYHSRVATFTTLPVPLAGAPR